tara:strand:- start:236 stop:709 length:474 start_codon:yes stop_codon:yes gene_type:complete
MATELKPKYVRLWLKNHDKKVKKGTKKNEEYVHPPFKYNDKDEVESVFTTSYAVRGENNGHYKTTVYEDHKEIIVPFVSNKSGNNKYNYEFLKKMTNKDLMLFVGDGWNKTHFNGRLYNVKLLGKADEYSGDYFKFKINEKIQDYIYKKGPYNRRGY